VEERRFSAAKSVRESNRASAPACNKIGKGTTSSRAAESGLGWSSASSAALKPLIQKRLQPLRYLLCCAARVERTLLSAAFDVAVAVAPALPFVPDLETLPCLDSESLHGRQQHRGRAALQRRVKLQRIQPGFSPRGSYECLQNAARRLPPVLRRAPSALPGRPRSGRADRHKAPPRQKKRPRPASLLRPARPQDSEES
jgi:hypothetical protein